MGLELLLGGYTEWEKLCCLERKEKWKWGIANQVHLHLSRSLISLFEFCTPPSAVQLIATYP